MQDNELWQRHLLVLVTQTTVAGYVVSRSSWLDRRLLAATALMFLCGLFKYGERTWWLVPLLGEAGGPSQELLAFTQNLRRHGRPRSNYSESWGHERRGFTGEKNQENA